MGNEPAGKKVLSIGGAGGIGAVCASAPVAQGAHVIVADRYEAAMVAGSSYTVNAGWTA